MATPLILQENEKKLFDEISSLLAEARVLLSPDIVQAPAFVHQKKYNKKIREMAQKAHELHMLLKKRGEEPKFNRHMLRNRGVPPTNVKFYEHIHAIEDLIKFIENPDVVPTDSTIGDEFVLRIYSRRWDHYDNYSFSRTKIGWRIRSPFSAEPSATPRNGEPALQRLLDQDYISYPHNIGDLLAQIWEEAADGKDKETVQKAFDALAKWISQCEKSVPKLFAG